MPSELVVSRVLLAPLELVFRAWSSSEHVKRWFCPARYSVPVVEIAFDAVYDKVSPDERITFHYEMRVDARKIALSQVIYELQSIHSGTQLVMTERCTFLEGYPSVGSHEQGARFLLDSLGELLPSG
jgi:uncharacterized protein YndB with AHSA1/START domain